MSTFQVKDPQDFIQKALGIVSFISKSAKGSRLPTKGEIAKSMGISIHSLSPTATTQWARIMRYLIENQFIAVRRVGLSHHVSLMKPVEDIEAHFASVKITPWKRLKKSRPGIVKVETLPSTEIEALPEQTQERPNSIIVEAHGVRVSINLNTDEQQKTTGDSSNPTPI